MSELDNLKTRLTYRGGISQEDRMIKDKEKSLKKALLYSYQAEIAQLADGREFRCLINSDKTKNDYDQKIISIPFIDKELTGLSDKPKYKDGTEDIGLQAGDVFKWKQTDTYWLVFLNLLEENANAYFRGEIRRCKEVVTIEENEYHVYIRGPVETTIQWLQKQGINWNKLNYSLELYITKNKETLDYFHRFKTVKINNNNWEVKAIDTYSGDNIIQVLLGEDYNNTIKDKYYIEPKAEQEPSDLPRIAGPLVVRPYDVVTYGLENVTEKGGTWTLIDGEKETTLIQDEEGNIELNVVTSKGGKTFTLKYNDEFVDLSLDVQVVSL